MEKSSDLCTINNKNDQMKRTALPSESERERLLYNTEVVFFDHSQPINPSDLGRISRLDAPTVFFCESGTIELSVDKERPVLTAGHMLVCSPNMMVANFQLSDDARFFVASIPSQAFKDCILVNKGFWKYALILHERHTFRLEKDDMAVFRSYCQMLAACKRRTGRVYHRMAVRSILEAFVYELLGLLEDCSSAKVNLQNYRQGDQLFLRFLSMLTDSKGQMHQVSDFADVLCVTPKYLSFVVKANSGKTPKQLIDELVKSEVERQLHYTKKSIKQICDDLAFVNLSFFGKYVKRHFGLSPAGLRKKLNEEF